MTESKFPTYKDHLNKTFLEELNYKIWVTKGSRFLASRRLLRRNDLSNTTIGFLSAYLIILGLITVYQISMNPIISPNLLAFSSTAISILVLLYSQIEASRDYKMRAHYFHDCSLKLAPLYNQTRIFKTLKETTEEEKEAFGSKLSEQYQQVLNHFENHAAIDYRMFQADQAKYFELDKFDVFRIKVSYYLQTYLSYHVLILMPILIMILLILKSEQLVQNDLSNARP